MQKITFYRIADGDGYETRNFFSKNVTTDNIQRIEYNFDTNRYVIFSKTTDGERQWEFNTCGHDSISNIQFSGHGIAIDFNASLCENKGVQLFQTGREEIDFNNFCN